MGTRSRHSESRKESGEMKQLVSRCFFKHDRVDLESELGPRVSTNAESAYFALFVVIVPRKPISVI